MIIFKYVNKTFENTIGQFRLTYVNKWLNKAKPKGVEGENFFKLLFVLVFVDFKNINQFMHSGYRNKLNHGKDVLYDFLKNERVDWGKILTYFSRQFIKITKSLRVAMVISSPKCLIIDDTLLCKTGKIIETIGKVFDQRSGSYQLGMKALVCGLRDRKSFIPTAFSVHNEPGKNRNSGLKNKELINQIYKERDDYIPGFQRVKQVSSGKI